MPNYKLTYFDFDGGRGEPIRIALHAAGIEFEDHRISFEEFIKTRPEMRFTCAPTLEIGDVVVTQSNGILRYVGKLAGLYPEDPMQALYADEAMGAVEDMLHQLVTTFGLEGDELKAARAKLADGWLTIFIEGLGEILERGGNEYFADNRLSVADLKVYVQMKSIRSGHLDHVPADLVDRLAPNLAEHADRIDNESIVKSYYASRKKS
jgi:glutathione S-transferase